MGTQLTSHLLYTFLLLLAAFSFKSVIEFIICLSHSLIILEVLDLFLNLIVNCSKSQIRELADSELTRVSSITDI